MSRATVRARTQRARLRAWAFAFALVAGAAPPAVAQVALSQAALAKAEPRLVGELRDARGPVSVWVEFRDRGARGPAELARMLADAESRLTPRARARRIRAGVRPLVDERDLPVHAPYLEALRDAGLRPYGVSRWFNQAAVRVDPEGLNRIAAWPFVVRLSAVDRMRPSPLPRDVETGATPAPEGRFGNRAADAIDYGRTQALAQQIHIPAVHDSGYTGAGVLVCVLDAGFNGWNTHESLATIDVPPGHTRDFVDGDTNVTGNFSHDHGGWVLALIAGHRPGDYVGTAPSATFALGRTEVFVTETPAEMVYWMQGAEWADSLGADLLTSSLGYSTFDDEADDYSIADLDGRTTIVSRAAQIAASKGILLVNSAGNEGNNPGWRRITAPADVHGDSLIAAGAVSLSGTRAAFSSTGPTADGRIKPDVMALGVSVPIISTTNSTGYGNGDGTSFAAPIVAGLAATLLEARPSWTAVQVIRALRETSSGWLQPDTLYGYGVPNGGAALRWPESVAEVPPPVSFPEIALAGPNPFRVGGPLARVQFALHRTAEAAQLGVVRVHDVQGRRVRTLWEGRLEVGEWVSVTWDGRDDGGAAVDAGIFFISLEAAGYVRSVRLALLP